MDTVEIELQVMNLDFYVDSLRDRWPWERWFCMEGWRRDFGCLVEHINKSSQLISFLLSKGWPEDTPEIERLGKRLVIASQEYARQSGCWW